MCVCTFQSFCCQFPLSLPPLPNSPPDHINTLLEPYCVIQVVASAINQVRNLPVSCKSFWLIFTSNRGMDKSLENIDTHF